MERNPVPLPWEPPPSLLRQDPWCKTTVALRFSMVRLLEPTDYPSATAIAVVLPLLPSAWGRNKKPEGCTQAYSMPQIPYEKELSLSSL